MTIDPLTRAELMELHARYAFTIDDGDAEGWAACFTSDGVMETTRPVCVSGRAALVDFARDRATSAVQPCRHVTWHETFEPVGDGRVRGRCSATILESTQTGVQALFTATYRDEFVREGSGWKLRRRHVLIDRPKVVPE